jgi:type I restriction enzyme, S subunit
MTLPQSLKIEDLAKVTMGLSPGGETYNYEGVGLPLLNGPTEFGVTFPKCTMFTTDSKRVCKKGDLIFCVRGSTTGRMNWADKQYSIGRGVCAIHGKDELTTKFVKYAIQNQLDGLLQITGGGTFPNLRKPDLENFKLTVPPNYKRIAEILSAYDDLIENNLKRIKLLEELAQRTYEEWFVKFRVNGEQLPIDESTGLPVGWEKKSISTIGEFINGFAFKPSDFLEKGIPIIKIKEMKNGVGSDTPLNDGSRVPKKYLVKRGDLLFSWSGSLEVVIWQGVDGWLNQHLFKVVPKSGIPMVFLHQSLLSVLEEFNNLTTGATMKHIKRKELDFVKVSIPTSEILSDFSDSITPVQQQILTLANQNQKLIQSRDILLPRLMNGSITVTP